MKDCPLCYVLVVGAVYILSRMIQQKKLLSQKDFSQLKLLKKFTRSKVNDICDCSVCDLARKPPANFANFAKGDTLPPRRGILSDVTNVKLKG